MRGKVLGTGKSCDGVGITPAYAGKRPAPPAQLPLLKDHPRVCGEKRIQPSECEQGGQSPPRMRGKVKICSVRMTPTRITPAHAGKSPVCIKYLIWIEDHPRTCGEKCLLGVCRLVESRITPAHAGKRLKRSRSIVSHAAIVPLFPSVCNKPAGSDGSPAGHDAPPFLPIENAAPASPAYNLRSL